MAALATSSPADLFRFAPMLLHFLVFFLVVRETGYAALIDRELFSADTVHRTLYVERG